MKIIENKLIKDMLSNNKISISNILNNYKITKEQLFEILENINNKYSNSIYIFCTHDLLKIKVYNLDIITKVLDEGTIDNFNVVENRQRFILKKLLELGTDDYIKIDEISEWLFVSRGTVNNDINSLRIKMIDEDLSIIGVPNRGLRIEGPEIKKWIYHSKNISYKELLNHKIFKYSQVDNLLNELIDILKTKFYINLKTEVTLKKNISLAIININRNIRIPDNSSNMFDLEVDPFVETHIKNFASIFEINILNNEMIFMVSPLFAKELLNPINYYKNKQMVLEIYKNIVIDIEDQIITNIDYDKLFSELKYHLFLVLIRTYFKFETPDFICEEMKFKFPLAYELASISIDSISVALGSRVNSSEISYLAIYFQKYLSSESIQRFNIALVSDYSEIVITLIKKELYALIGNDIQVDCYTVRNFSEINFDDVSLILASTNIDRINNVPIYQVEDVFDKEKFSKQLSILSLKKIVDTSGVVVRGYKIEEISSYLEIISHVANNLEIKKLVDGEFRKRVVNKESNKPIIFSNGIALPHTITTYSEIVCCYCYLNKPITYKGYLINSVVLLAIPKELNANQEKTLLELYEHLFSLGNNDIKDVSFMKKFVENIEYTNISSSGIILIKK